jgi:CheY-like chemotaxis protein/HPt (histidine-containing phosphotransfer) domain-containing protein
METRADVEQPGVTPRVLLVEDNEINQEIACELLRDLHADVTVAEQGEQAVEAVKSGQYDIILMDIEMPVMNGVEATRRIRASGIPWTERVPIIAMTGHDPGADVGGRFPGMNAYLAKPIDPQLLRRAFATWLPHGQAGSEHAGPEQAGFGQTAASVPGVPAGTGTSREDMRQIYGINAGAGIDNVAGNETLYFDLLGRFAAKYRDSRDDLLGMLKRGEIESASRLAHTIKGVAANLGAVQLADMAKKIETALLAHESITPLIDPYAQEMAKVARGIERLTSDNAPPAVPEGRLTKVDEEFVPLILDTLKDLPHLLQTDWGQAQEIVEGLASLLEHTQAASTYARLRNALEEFNPAAFAAEADNLTKLLV